MGHAQSQPGLDEAFERIEETILPSLSMMLDSLFDAAALGRPGIDADAYAGELRTLGRQLETLTRELATVAGAAAADEGYRASRVA